jgi:hypothetical protein
MRKPIVAGLNVVAGSAGMTLVPLLIPIMGGQRSLELMGQLKR